MKILGIDPGLARTGWGLVEVKNGVCSKPQFDCITTKASQPSEFRLLEIFNGILEVIRSYNPDQASIEKLFFNTNAKTAMLVGQARGVVLLALTKKSIPVFHYTPLQIKIAITGYGRADKQQMQKMIKTLLHLDKIPSPDDISDALAAALTHAYSFKPL